MRGSSIGIFLALALSVGCATARPQWVTFPDGGSGKDRVLVGE